MRKATSLFLIQSLILFMFPVNSLAGQDDEGRNIHWWEANCPAVLMDQKPAECSVNEFGHIGRFGNEDFYYALYWSVDYYGSKEPWWEPYKKTPNNNVAVVLFRGAAGGDMVRPFWDVVPTDPALGWYEAPRIEGDYLVIPYFVSGTGHYYGHRYIAISELMKNKPLDKSAMLDVTSWSRDLGKWLPKGHGIWKGVKIDMNTLKAESPVWKEEDANCCSTGGHVEIMFYIKDNRLYIKDVKYEPDNSGVR